MSKKSKARASLERKKEKARRKESQRLKYQSMRDQGINSKSKRFLLRSKRGRKSLSKHMHLVANCGNPGCKNCFPRENVMHFEIGCRVYAHVVANAHLM